MNLDRVANRTIGRNKSVRLCEFYACMHYYYANLHNRGK